MILFHLNGTENIPLKLHPKKKKKYKDEYEKEFQGFSAIQHCNFIVPRNN
jgi:hypothetical protein